MTQISLLWPSGNPVSTWEMLPETVRDLELEAVIEAMCPHEPYREIVRAVVSRLCLDEETICYRQDIFADLQAHPRLAQTLLALLPTLDELALFSFRKTREASRLHEIIARAGELELLVTCIHQLQQAFTAVSTPLRAIAFQKLQSRVMRVAKDAHFQEMVDQLPQIMNTLRTSASMTIGVNLDHFLRPEEAVLLAVNDFRFTESSFLDRLMGKGAADGKGIAPLHVPPMVSQTDNMITGGLPTHGPPKRVDPLLLPLFKDLSNVLDKVTQPIALQLQKFVQLNGRFLVDLRPEIIFYVQALALVQKLQERGMQWSFPQIAPKSERICSVKGAANLLLAIQSLRNYPKERLPDVVVANDIALGENGRIAILTGPNQGGKTIFMQAVGFVQILAQLGLPIPGEAGRVSIVDAIYTHYPVEEQLERGTGRFGDEAQRIRAIFEQLTTYSLVLFNESLATTNTGESIYLAKDIVRMLRKIGLRAIFTTHLHDLAAAAATINEDTAGDSDVFSLVASRVDAQSGGKLRRSFQVHAGPPMGRSYASHIAEKHGIGYEQLQTLLKQRQLL